MPPVPSNPVTIKRIHREIADLKREDLGPMTLNPTDNLHIWKGSLPGPQGSPYEGGVFEVDIQLPSDYPFSAPKVTFATRIYHMNVSEKGNICIDILKSNWSPALSIFKVMLSLSSLLTDPNPNDPLVPSIAKQYQRSRKQHDTTARSWVELYAKPKSVPSTISPPIPPQTKQPSRKAKATPVLSGATIAASSSSQATIPHESIFIDDSDSERQSNAPSAGQKRKRGRQVDDNNVIEIMDDDADHAPSQTRRRTSDYARPSQLQQPLGEIIVIDD